MYTIAWEFHRSEKKVISQNQFYYKYIYIILIEGEVKSTLPVSMQQLTHGFPSL